MKGDNEILQALNASLKDQLTTINQTFLHARMAKDWGLGKFNEHEYRHSIQAMKQADAVVERILFLEGLPNLQDLGKLMIGENIPEMIQGDLDMYMGLRSNLLGGMRLSEEKSDYITRDLFEDMLEHVEEIIDWYETQQWLVGNTGLENYLQTLAGGA